MLPAPYVTCFSEFLQLVVSAAAWRMTMIWCASVSTSILNTFFNPLQVEQ
jgi:hypothetical protein